MINEKRYHHQFDSTMSTWTLIVKQRIFYDIIKSMTWIKFLKRTPRNNKSFFIKYLTNQGKNVLISTSVTTSRLLPIAKIIHTQYLYMDIYILWSNLIIHYKRFTNVFFLYEMSLLTNIMLSSIYTNIK